MTNVKAPIMSGWCLSCWKQDLTLLAYMEMSWSRKVNRRIQMCMRKLTMTIPNMQSSSMLSFVDVMRLTRIESMVDCLEALKMSLSFFPSLTRSCCNMKKMCRMNLDSQAVSGMTKLLNSCILSSCHCHVFC